jgi:hypothetical protein
MIFRPIIFLFAVALLCAGCTEHFRRREMPKPGRHLTLSAKDSAELSEREYLMRKATIGSRPERIEALDVIDRAADPEMFPFLIERLQKEDDRFIQIRIMHALGNYGDVRAVPPLRRIARWDDTRVGIEATAALYDLGDDSFVPRLILNLRQSEEFPEKAGITHRALKKMTGVDLPPTQRAWLNYYRSHRLAPYQSKAWFWPFRPPLPPTVEGTTKIVPHTKGRAPLPQEDVKLRRTNVTWTDWWKSED